MLGAHRMSLALLTPREEQSHWVLPLLFVPEGQFVLDLLLLRMSDTLQELQ